jgi:hypothetical protein
MCDRGVFEESDLSILDPKLCGLLMFPKFKGNDWYVFAFTATKFTGELIDSPEGRLESPVPFACLLLLAKRCDDPTE